MAEEAKTGISGPGPGDATGARRPARDFIRATIDEDLRTGKHDGRVVTRFPPEPNGYLHIGHAKAICLNFGIAGEYGGVCHLRFDDTNPETEDIRYVEAAKEDVRWLGFDWGEHLYFASDYFERMYELAEELIRKGLAYVDSQSEEEIRENRGTIAEPGRTSPYRDRPVDENLDLFRRMRAGEFPDGAHVLRARIDMASPNMLLRDPVLYRIRHAHHYRTGDAWCLYPLYDFAHPLEDALECVTHSLCTLEFETNRALYDWIVENTNVPCRPYQYEFARLNLDYTVMSKRKLLELVRRGHVAGWDDPRMPTIAGLRRRGVTPEAIRAFAESVGVTKAASRTEMAKLEFAIRDDLNRRVPRVLCVMRPLRVVITDWPEGKIETLDAPLYPHDVPLEGERPLSFGRQIYIDRDDFMEDPPPDYHRLAPGREVRLRHAYIIRCDEVVKNDAGEIVELRCSHDPDGRASRRRVQGTIHWVSAEHAVPCEVRLYDRLFTVPEPDAAAADAGRDFTDYLNPESLVVLQDARVEAFVANGAAGSRYQFERVGYFYVDPQDSAPDLLVFNRVVTLRDTWAKVTARQVAEPAAAGGPGAAPDAARHRGRRPPERRPTSSDVAAGDVARPPHRAPAERSPELDDRARRFAAEYDLSPQDAILVTRDAATADLFEHAVSDGAPPGDVANWIIHELPRALAGRDPADLRFGGAELAVLVRMVADGVLTGPAAREVLSVLVEEGGDPAEIVDRRGLRKVEDPAELAAIIEEVLAQHPDEAAAYRGGRTALLGFFVGQVMRRTSGRADPKQVQAVLRERLG